MTRTNLVHSEIDRFLRSDKPEVLCLTGKWGVGKTYTWKYYVREAQTKGAIALKRYAYVSIFGQNSLENLRATIFEETEDVDQIEKTFDFNSLSALANKAKTYGPWLFNHARKFVPWLKDAPEITERWLFLTVRNQIVCFDDLERAGKGLEIKDVLGLISFLKEDRDCKVVILLNEDELGVHADEYKMLLEKVVDVRLEFEPTAAEAAEIGLAPNTAVRDHLQHNVVALGIVNIRVIKKIERLALELAELLKEYDPAVLKQALHSVTLFSWINFQPGEAPPLSFVTEFNSWSHLLKDKDDSTDEEKSWRALLQSYQFLNLDEFDKVLLDGVQAGAFDPEEISGTAKPLEAQIIFQRQDSSFSDAWHLFHRSLNIPADKVLDKMAVAFKNAVKTITPNNLSGTLLLFKELGRPQQAKELLDYYMNARSDEAVELFDLQKSPFGSEVKDPDVRAAFAAKAATSKVHKDPKTILIELSKDDGWNSEDLEFLAKVTPAELKAIFKSTEGPELPQIINGALSFGRISNPSADMTAILANANSALRSIAAESPINARRLARYGIVPEAT